MEMLRLDNVLESFRGEFGEEIKRYRRRSCSSIVNRLLRMLIDDSVPTHQRVLAYLVLEYMVEVDQGRDDDA
jgi:hypothetical protein